MEHGRCNTDPSVITDYSGGSLLSQQLVRAALSNQQGMYTSFLLLLLSNQFDWSHARFLLPGHIVLPLSPLLSLCLSIIPFSVSAHYLHHTLTFSIEIWDKNVGRSRSNLVPVH